MTKPYKYPYPCEYRPRFTSQNDAYVFVERFIKHGDMKDCSYLRVSMFESGYTGHDYGPDCEKDSFKTEETEHYSTRLFYGCPKDCRLFQAAWKGRMKKRLRATHRGIKGFGRWLVELVRAASGFMKQ
jgi:hypothetical protein